jgi:HK97 family phage prohead protease
VSEILTRSDGVLAGIDFKERLIDLIAVPWGQVARVFWRGELWDEVIEPGAFDGVESRAGRVRVNREHLKGDTVGKVVEFDPSDKRGLFARIRIAETARGEETLRLAAEDMISASIGYKANKPSDVVLNKEAKMRRVKSAFLDHVGMVEDPAFEGAQVLAVRDDELGITMADGPLQETPVLDRMLQDPVIAWVMKREATGK